MTTDVTPNSEMQVEDVIEQDPSWKNLSEDANAALLAAAGCGVTETDVEESCAVSGSHITNPEVSSLKVTDHDLQVAALAGDVELVRRLIGEGTSVNAPMRCNDPDGDTFATLLHVLSSRPDLPNCTEVLNVIIKVKANLNGRSSTGSTPLIRACFHKHVGAVEMLLVYGADVKTRDDKRSDASASCVMLIAPKVVADSGAAAATATKVLQERSAQILQLLAEKSADLDQRGNTENAPLHEAIIYNNFPAVVALTELGAKPRFLHGAVEKSNKAVIEHLLNAEADPFHEDRDGQTVLDIAFKRGDEDITTLLRNHIGDLERQGAPGGLLMSKRMSISTVGTRSSANSTGSSTNSQESDEEGGLGLSKPWETISTPLSFGRKDSMLSIRRLSQSLGMQQPREIIRKKVNSKFAQWLKKKWKELQERCVEVNNNRYFQAVMLGALLSVLFLPDLWVVCNVERNDDLDIILIIVLFLFILEIFVQTFGNPKVYINSFFFWMDLVGACSVPLDHSAVNDPPS
jgi:ankyrin repeat protein